MNSNTLTVFRVLLIAAILAVSHGLAPRSSSSSSTTNPNTRRAFIASSSAAAVVSSFWGLSGANAAQEKEYRQGIEVNAFNGLIFNYRGGDFNGLDATAVNEPSVSYAEFNERLKSSQVASVEFLAPDGDVAYVTFKDSDKKVRIGEGYPIEQHDGYSSPMFCVRAVKNAGVPYKFVVPALMKKNS
jgi:hypothetical protein